jgi:hypothetical protein
MSNYWNNTRDRETFADVAEQIESVPNSYDQSVWGQPNLATPCGTRACLGGWAAIKSGALEARDVQEGSSFIREYGQSALGITETEADVLFHSNWHPPYGMTVPQALRALAHGARLESVTDHDCDAAVYFPIPDSQSST